MSSRIAVPVLASLLVLTGAPAGPAEGPEIAQPPSVTVDIPAGEPSGRTVAVPSGGDLQAALDAARPGDIVSLEPGAVYRGPFTLPKKAGSDWIAVRTGGNAGIPPPGTRVDPGQAPRLAKLVASSGAVVKTAPGAHHYRLSGLEIRPTDSTFLYNLVEIGGAETSPDQFPHHVIIERCVLHGDPKRGTRRGVALNGMHTA